MRNYHTTVAMAVIKRCAASGRALQAKSAASEIQHVKNTFAENFAITNTSMNKRRFAVMSSLHTRTNCKNFLPRNNDSKLGGFKTAL